MELVSGKGGEREGDLSVLVEAVSSSSPSTISRQFTHWARVFIQLLQVSCAQTVTFDL